MSFPVVITSEQVEKSLAWTRAFYEVCDSSDTKRWITEFFHPNAIVRLGKVPPMKGHEAILAHFERQGILLKSMKHTIGHVDVLPERIYVEIEAVAVIKNDPTQQPIHLGGLDVIGKKIDENKATFTDAYVDLAPLLERVKMFS